MQPRQTRTSHAGRRRSWNFGLWVSLRWKQEAVEYECDGSAAWEARRHKTSIQFRERTRHGERDEQITQKIRKLAYVFKIITSVQ